MKENSLTPYHFQFQKWIFINRHTTNKSVSFPERVRLERDSRLPKPNQMTLCNLRCAINSKEKLGWPPKGHTESVNYI